MSNLSSGFVRIASGDLLGVPIPIVVLCLVAAAGAVLLRKVTMGRYIYAIGGNESAARASGVRVERVKILAYTLSGALAGLAGVVLTARITTGQPTRLSVMSSTRSRRP